MPRRYIPGLALIIACTATRIAVAHVPEGREMDTRAGAWHFPRLFQASLASDATHALQHGSFLATALLFWSSLSGPAASRRQGAAVLSLLTTAIHTGILGALLTFSPHAWYPAYAGKSEAWGLTMLEDQQLGGLIMWVPAGFLFVFAGLAAAAKAIGRERTA